MTIGIRSIELGDNAMWEELFDGYLQFYRVTLAKDLIQLSWQRLIDPNFNSFGLLAEVDGKVSGVTHFSFQNSTWAIKNYCYLEDLFVSPEARGKGVGQALIDSVLEIARKEGSGRLYWNTDATNEAARRLYDKYTPASEKVQYRIQLS